jgi:hypothetical protein
MSSYSRLLFGTLIVISVLMILVLGLHVGGQSLVGIGNYSPLLGALIGGSLTFYSVNVLSRREKDVEPWLKFEKLSWLLMGCGCFAWAAGECFWRYYREVGQTPFPSLADAGYTCFPPFVFVGLFLLINSGNKHRRVFFLLDSLIATGALLSIAWFLLLGSLAQTPAETLLAKVLTFYYPVSDTILLSSTIFLLLRERDLASQATSRRIALFVIGTGLVVFAASDFIFNLQENLGTYTEGSWNDLGWPLGMMLIGVAAYLRCTLPATPREVLEQRLNQGARRFLFEPAQALPYLLVIGLFCILIFNVLTNDSGQLSIRPVLVLATMLVVCLVLARQILTILDNAQLLRVQQSTLQALESLNQSVMDRNEMLETGVTHLKDIQTRLANGDVRARAAITSGELWPLAVGLNLMADRMMRTERNQLQMQRLSKVIDDLSLSLARVRSGGQFVPPASALDFPEIHRLLTALGVKISSGSGTTQPNLSSGSTQPNLPSGISSIRPLHNSSAFPAGDPVTPYPRLSSNSSDILKKKTLQRPQKNDTF